jgi:small subunit ribosomal protein S9
MTARKTKAKKVDQIYTVGRRKSAVARLYMVPGKGQVTVNGKDIKEYFGGTTVYPAVATRPMQVVDAKSDFDVSVNVYGGGPNGQADAISLAIARALCKHEKKLVPIAQVEEQEEGSSEGQGANALLKWRTSLKALKLLTRNARIVERKKVGFRKARKKEQYSKR